MVVARIVGGGDLQGVGADADDHRRLQPVAELERHLLDQEPRQRHRRHHQGPAGEHPQPREIDLEQVEQSEVEQRAPPPPPWRCRPAPARTGAAGCNGRNAGTPPGCRRSSSARISVRSSVTFWNEKLSRPPATKQASIAATSATGNASSDPTALRRGAKPDRSAASSVDIDAPHPPGTPGAAPRPRGLGSSRRPGASRSELTAPAVR